MTAKGTIDGAGCLLDDVHTLLCSPSYNFPITHAQLVRRALAEHLLKASQRHIENQHLIKFDNTDKIRRFYTQVQKNEKRQIRRFLTRVETKNGKRSIRRCFTRVKKRETVDPPILHTPKKVETRNLPIFYTRRKTGNAKSGGFSHALKNVKLLIRRFCTRRKCVKLSIRRFYARRKMGNCQIRRFYTPRKNLEAVNPSILHASKNGKLLIRRVFWHASKKTGNFFKTSAYMI